MGETERRRRRHDVREDKYHMNRTEFIKIAEVIKTFYPREGLLPTMQELIDSALIDGSDQFRAFLKIVIPLSKPVMAVIMIYTIVGTWNAWFGASIYTTNRDIQPVQLYMRHVLAATSTSMQSQMLEQLPEELRLAYQKKALAANQIKYALIVLTTLPIIAVYPMFQKHFTKGIMLGSLKG